MDTRNRHPMSYILLSRSILDSEIWTGDPHLLKLFIWCIGKAQHERKPRKLAWGVVVNRGEFVTTLSQIAQQNRYRAKHGEKQWTRTKVFRMIHKLENEKMLDVVRNTHGMHLKVCNYDTYQTPDNYMWNGCETDVKRYRNGSSSKVARENDLQRPKNDKNGKNERSKRGGASMTRPTPTQVEEYAKSIGFPLDAEHFVDYYASQGWRKKNGRPLKDWQAAVRTWRRLEEKRAGEAGEADSMQEQLRRGAEEHNRSAG